MAKKELVNNDAATLRVTEEALDVIEDQIENIEAGIEAAEEAAKQVVTIVRNNPYVLVGVALIGLSTGAYLGYRYGIKKATLNFEAKLEEETDAIRAHHKRLYKEGFFDTPEGAVQALHPDKVEKVESITSPTESFKTAGKALTNYQGYSKTPVKETVVEETTTIDVGPDRTMPDESERPVEIENVFDKKHEDVWDYKVELYHRASLPEGKPYVIHEDEFHENEGGYSQGHLAFYEGDGTLTDERDQPIMNTDDVLGDDITDQFGHGSLSPHIVFVRSDKLQMDWEIVRSEGTYNTDVLGFQEDDGPSLRHSMQRRRRSADE